MFKNIILTIILLSQTACTSVVWNGGIYDADRAIQTHTVIQTTAQDPIYAMTRLPDNSGEWSGSLILLGEQYWYALQTDISEPVMAAFTADLSQPYQLTAPYRGNVLSVLPITITDKQQFSSDFCLDYHATQPEEIAKLQQLAFQVQAQPQHYRQCYAITGKIYAKPSRFTVDYRLRTNITAQLTFEQNQIDIHAGKLAMNLLLTPWALAVDTVSGMIMLPVLMIGDLF